jgi:hypothetical protein
MLALGLVSTVSVQNSRREFVVERDALMLRIIRARAAKK